MFPQLLPETVQSAAVAASSSRSVPKDIVIEARQRQLHRTLMNELLKSISCAYGKRTTFLYRTRTWEQKSKAMFVRKYEQGADLLNILHQHLDLSELDHTEEVLRKVGPFR